MQNKKKSKPTNNAPTESNTSESFLSRIPNPFNPSNWIRLGLNLLAAGFIPLRDESNTTAGFIPVRDESNTSDVCKELLEQGRITNLSGADITSTCSTLTNIAANNQIVAAVLEDPRLNIHIVPSETLSNQKAGGMYKPSRKTIIIPSATPTTKKYNIESQHTSHELTHAFDDLSGEGLDPSANKLLTSTEQQNYKNLVENCFKSVTQVPCNPKLLHTLKGSGYYIEVAPPAVMKPYIGKKGMSLWVPSDHQDGEYKVSSADIYQTGNHYYVDVPNPNDACLLVTDFIKYGLKNSIESVVAQGGIAGIKTAEQHAHLSGALFNDQDRQYICPQLYQFENEVVLPRYKKKLEEMKQPSPTSQSI